MLCQKDGHELDGRRCPVCQTYYLPVPTSEEAANAFVDAVLACGGIPAFDVVEVPE